MSLADDLTLIALRTLESSPELRMSDVRIEQYSRTDLPIKGGTAEQREVLYKALIKYLMLQGQS